MNVPIRCAKVTKHQKFESWGSKGPNVGQIRAEPVLAGPCRHICLVGGSRSGKTFQLVRAVIVRALRGAHSRHVILRFRENAVWRSIGLDTFPSVMRTCFPGIPYLPRRADGFFQFTNKAEVWLGGLDEKERVERILGQEFVTLYLNECSQIPYSSYLMSTTRLAQQIPGLRQRAYFDLNPTGKGHWTNQLFGQKKNPLSHEPLANPDDYDRVFMNPRDNADNLSPEYLATMAALPERQRKRFYEGVYVDETEGALWTYDTIERCRAPHPGDDALQRVVVAVDASGASGREDLQADEIGIVVAALGQDGHGYVLADRSCRESPAVWGKVVAKAVEDFDADCVVAERNFGGDMVRFVIKTAAPKVLVKMVTASRGKVVRAEPISALYGDEKTPSRVHHVERFPMLEEQLCAFTTMGYLGEESPDRADACLVAGTLVTTTCGDRKIETIKVGDEVLTRAGYRRVLHAGMTNATAQTYEIVFSDGRRLLVTANHPIYVVGKGFIPVDALVWGDMVLPVNEVALWNRNPRSSWSWTAAFIGVIRTAGVRTLNAIIRSSAEGDFASITVTSGKSTTVRFRTDFTSITRTRTRSTTTSPTMNVFLRWNMLLAIWMTNGTKGLLNFWIQSGILPLNGTDHQRGSHGIASMGNEHGKDENVSLLGIAPTAENRSNLSSVNMSVMEVDDIVLDAAIALSPTERKNTLWKWFVQFVGKLSKHGNGGNGRKLAPVYVVRVSASNVEPVFNLQVEDQPEFFANGVLVHNCVWALTELMLKGQTPVMVGPIIVTTPVVPHGTHEGFQ